jgi:hypothetical protein
MRRPANTGTAPLIPIADRNYQEYEQPKLVILKYYRYVLDFIDSMVAPFTVAQVWSGNHKPRNKQLEKDYHEKAHYGCGRYGRWLLCWSRLGGWNNANTRDHQF